MSGPVQQSVKTVMDSTIGVGAISLPLWMQYLQTWVGFIALIGGTILLGMRLVIAYRDIKKKPDDK